MTLYPNKTTFWGTLGLGFPCVNLLEVGRDTIQPVIAPMLPKIETLFNLILGMLIYLGFPWSGDRGSLGVNCSRPPGHHLCLLIPTHVLFCGCWLLSRLPFTTSVLPIWSLVGSFVIPSTHFYHKHLLGSNLPSPQNCDCHPAPSWVSRTIGGLC